MMTSIEFRDLPLEQKIGQMLFIGIPGTEIDAETLDILKRVSPGGICLFSRNIKSARQTRELLENLRNVLPFEPFLSLDQEGGLVDRLRRVVTPMPSAQTVSGKGTIENTRQLGTLTGKIIKSLGFNMNFAPVVDVVDDRRDKFVNGLYSRAFGKSKEEVVEHASAYVEALQKENCIATIKHFPGYGATETDSHEELPLIGLSDTQIAEIDLYPYERLFKETDIKAVMIGHAAYPDSELQERDENGAFIPSSVSRSFVTGLLREKYGFDGLALTDDLEMGAIVKNYGMGRAAKMAVNAGNDFLLICASPQAINDAFEAVLEAVKSGEIDESRVVQSLERIFRIRESLTPPPPFDERLIETLSEEIKHLNAIC